MKAETLYDLIAPAPETALLGMCKNAGKTTALNALIRAHGRRGKGVLGLSSIGRDGERQDLVTGTEKPPIYLQEGMLAATAADLLPLSDISREILMATGLYTSMGEVIIFRARSDGFVQIAGPGIVADMGRLKDMLRQLGAEIVLVDGALSRFSPLAGMKEGRLILSTGASLDRDMERVIRETAFAARRLSLPQRSAEELMEEAKNPLMIGGAFTDSMALSLLRNLSREKVDAIHLRDASCLLIKRESYEALSARGVAFYVAEGSHLAAVTVNPVSAGGWTFPAEEFKEKMQAAVTVPVLNVMEEA